MHARGGRRRTYRFQKPDGSDPDGVPRTRRGERRREARRRAASSGSAARELALSRRRPGSLVDATSERESWALLLFCSTMSVLLSSAVRVDIIPWAATRVLATLPFLGATTFHLFTTYPIEPRWVSKRRGIRLIPYAIASMIAFGVVRSPRWAFRRCASCDCASSSASASVASMAILAAGRRQAREAGIGDRADLMLLAGLVSLLPAFSR